jgi:hypothetical protein
LVSWLSCLPCGNWCNTIIIIMSHTKRATFIVTLPDAMFDAIVEDHIFIKGGDAKAWGVTFIVRHVILVAPPKAVRDPL